MVHRNVFLTGVCLTFLLSATNASAIACPADQAFDGTLLPGNTDTISATTTARGDTYFAFWPRYCLGLGVQATTLTVGTDSATGDCGLSISYSNHAAGSFTISVRGRYLGIDGLALMPYMVTIHQVNCS
ncbi:MAG: hypothetical protein QOG31_202 [Thermoplasmata archaeon]|jgi:hypothetical protein|nr:hypothetical protein [Thermoplasmata archaeon]